MWSETKATNAVLEGEVVVWLNVIEVPVDIGLELEVVDDATTVDVVVDAATTLMDVCILGQLASDNCDY